MQQLLWPKRWRVKKKRAYLCSAWKTRQSDERWFTVSIIFVTVYEYLKRWKKSDSREQQMEKLHHISRGTNTDSLSLSHTHSEVHKLCTGADTHRIFNLQSDPAWWTIHVRLHCPLYLASKFHARHKSQILYDIVEIALSKMQSAKAASSADELLWLRKRQWLVSFAPIGSVEGREHGGPGEVASCILQIWWINIVECQVAASETFCSGNYINPVII